MKQWLTWATLGLSVTAVVGALAYTFRSGEVREQLEIAVATQGGAVDKAPAPSKEPLLLLRYVAAFAALVVFPFKQARYKAEKAVSVASMHVATRTALVIFL